MDRLNEIGAIAPARYWLALVWCRAAPACCSWSAAIRNARKQFADKPTTLDDGG